MSTLNPPSVPAPARSTPSARAWKWPCRTWPTPNRRAAPTASRIAVAMWCSAAGGQSLRRHAWPGRPPSASRSRCGRRPDAVPPPLRSVASRCGRRRIRRAAERRHPGRNGRHAVGEPRLSGQPHGHRPDPRHGSEVAGAGEVSHGRYPSIDAVSAAITPPRRPAVPPPRRSQPRQLWRALGQADRLRRQVVAQAANNAVGRMLDGTGDVHDAMIALQRAELIAAADGAGAQQAGAGLPGHHADAGLRRLTVVTSRQS